MILKSHFNTPRRGIHTVLYIFLTCSFLFNFACSANYSQFDEDFKKALINGDIDIVKKYLEHRTNANVKDSSSGFTPLMIASINGYIDVVKLLVEKGAKLNAKDTGGCTALYYASKSGYIDVVRLLLDKGALVDVLTSKGVSILHIAALCQQKFVVELLLSKGVMVGITDSSGQTALHYAVAGFEEKDLNKDGGVGIVNMLIDNGADVNAVSNSGSTPLHYAALNGHKNVVELLISKGAQINGSTNGGFSAVMLALSNKHIDVAKVLSSHGADVSQLDLSNSTNCDVAMVNPAFQKESDNIKINFIGTWVRYEAGGVVELLTTYVIKPNGSYSYKSYQSVNGHKNQASGYGTWRVDACNAAISLDCERESSGSWAPKYKCAKYFTLSELKEDFDFNPSL